MQWYVWAEVRGSLEGELRFQQLVALWLPWSRGGTHLLQARSSRPLSRVETDASWISFFQASKRHLGWNWGKSMGQFPTISNSTKLQPVVNSRGHGLGPTRCHGSFLAVAADLWLNGVSKIVACSTGKYILYPGSSSFPKHLEPSSQLPTCHGNHRPLLPNIKGTGRWGCSISSLPKQHITRILVTPQVNWIVLIRPFFSEAVNKKIPMVFHV